MIRTPSQATITELEREATVLEQRLLDGERRIEEAQEVGADTEAWEEFWIELLRTYETVYDRLESLRSSDRKVAA